MHSDYIMRMIEQFVQALATIVLNRKQKKYDQAIEQIQLASKKFLHSDIITLLQYDSKKLVDQFKDTSGRLNTEQCIVCAELFYEFALISNETQRPDVGQHLQMLSLHLYSLAIPLDKQFQVPKYLQKANSLLLENITTNFPEDVQSNISHYKKFLEKMDSTPKEKEKN